MKHQLKGAWVLISGENVGWPVDRSAKGDSLRAAIKAENIEIEKQNAALMEENWSKGTKHAMKPLREMPGLFYKEMCEEEHLALFSRHLYLYVLCMIVLY